MSSGTFLKPIRYRMDLTHEEKIAGIRSALATLRLGASIVLFNLVVPFNYQTLGGYYLPMIAVFAGACVIAHLFRTLSPSDPGPAQLMALLMAIAPVLLWLYGRDAQFTQRLLGQWYVPNIFAKLDLIQIACLVGAAMMIPKDEKWRPMHVAEFLVGVSIVGVGIPEREVYERTLYVGYSLIVAIANLVYVNSDIARCWRSWCACSPLASHDDSKAILRLPGDLMIDEPIQFGLTLRAWRLWLAMWPTPPESLDPQIVAQSHSRLMQREETRRFLAGLAYASTFAFFLCAFPPARAPQPYAVFLVEALSPLAIQFGALCLIHGREITRADRLSNSYGGRP